MIARKNYCERFHVHPFEGGYDKQPEWWLLGLRLIDTYEAEAIEFTRRKNGK